MARPNRKSPSRRHLAAAHALLAPSLERQQHDRVSVSQEQVVDANGLIGAPFIAESLLAKLELAGNITSSERRAGEEFQRLFYLAGLHGIRASDPARLVVAGAKSHAQAETAERAGNRIAAAMQAVGQPNSPARLVCWNVLGLELSLRDFEKLEGWSHRRPLSREASKGALVGALGILEKFFGTS